MKIALKRHVFAAHFSPAGRRCRRADMESPQILNSSQNMFVHFFANYLVKNLDINSSYFSGICIVMDVAGPL